MASQILTALLIGVVGGIGGASFVIGILYSIGYYDLERYR